MKMKSRNDVNLIKFLCISEKNIFLFWLLRAMYFIYDHRLRLGDMFGDEYVSFLLVLQSLTNTLFHVW